MTTELLPETAETEQIKPIIVQRTKPVKIEPDLEFIEEVSTAGGDTLKKCFQCATCSVVCTLTPESHPFPRKEMIWASWGLKDRLTNDPDIWLCHQCGDCSAKCPRGARPGDTLAAIRNYMFKTFTFPTFLGTWLSAPKYLPLVFAIPIVWLLVLLTLAGTIGTVPIGEIEFGKFLPHVYLYSMFITATHVAALFLIISLMRFWSVLGTAEVNMNGSNPGGPTQGNLAASLMATVKEILTQAKFKMCDENKHRHLGHLLIMYGFLAIAVGTGIAFLMMYGLRINPPFAQWTPPKILGHAGLIALIAGLIIVINRRLSDKENVSKATYQDWYLLLVLLAVAVTGIAVEFIRFADIAWLAYWSYIVHLVFVFALIGYFPYSKFAHMFYRFVAILHSKYSGRDVLVEATAAPALRNAQVDRVAA
jgi:quinone-modifying oxidoreductase subunit QmoC